MSHKNRHAFTLVELLVVIGIIALLISMILPSLNKARQAANVVYCKANLRQIGQAVQIYAAQSKGLAPWGDVFGMIETFNPASGAINNIPNVNNNRWNWQDTLSLLLKQPSKADSGAPAYDPLAPNKASTYSKVFTDVDLPMTEPGSGNFYYNGNWRYFAIPRRDPVTATSPRIPFSQCKASPKGAATMMIAWCGPQYTATGGSCDTVCWAIDNYTIYKEGNGGNQLLMPNPNTGGKPYESRVVIGATALAPVLDVNNPTVNELKAMNYDNNHIWDGPSMRFRHLNNTTANFLFGDGHCEQRRIGEVYEREICLQK